MDAKLLIASIIIVGGGVLLLSKQYARIGGLVAGIGFIPLGWYASEQLNSQLFLIFGFVIAALAIYRLFKPRTKM